MYKYFLKLRIGMFHVALSKVFNVFIPLIHSVEAP